MMPLEKPKVKVTDSVLLAPRVLVKSLLLAYFCICESETVMRHLTAI